MKYKDRIHLDGMVYYNTKVKLTYKLLEDILYDFNLHMAIIKN